MTASATRSVRMLPPALVAGGLAAATIALHLRDPHDQGSWGVCPTKTLFGVNCPGCGGLRAVNDLTNLQVIDAASSNLLFVVSLPLIAYAFFRWSQGRWTGRSWDPSERATSVSAFTVIAAMAVFAVVRNLAFGSWLAP
ncbi:DUF2752 domain-containing protein [Nocardioides humilatus]|uniref:DUF2752 domain-containing protein n=1 Tax=Nocardioides humilatus TaxID=2607660 RepID=A0A5B1LB40_9ACTN|nr:DUF2752 domain-containing protein [Nocardioides humilatus]KAA1417882.1 DUF2752 domain-containing protein [Nocardioides humilatus]